MIGDRSRSLAALLMTSTFLAASDLHAQEITVLRYGGSMIDHPEYRRKKMIGPRDRRPLSGGTRYPYSSNGWGILDFLNLCEVAGFLGIPAVNRDGTAHDLADFLDYVNGPATSPWGGRRAATLVTCWGRPGRRDRLETC